MVVGFLFNDDMQIFDNFFFGKVSKVVLFAAKRTLHFLYQSEKNIQKVLST